MFAASKSLGRIGLAAFPAGGTGAGVGEGAGPGWGDGTTASGQMTPRQTRAARVGDGGRATAAREGRVGV